MRDAEADPGHATQGLPRQRPWWRRALTLRTLMILVLIIGCGMGLLTNRIATRARAIATILESGGAVVFRDQDAKETGFWIWLHRWTEFESCREVDQVNYAVRSPVVGGPTRDVATVRRVVAAIGQLAETKRIVLSHCAVASSDLAPLDQTAAEVLHLDQIVTLTDDLPATAVLLPHLKQFRVAMADPDELPLSVLTMASRFPGLDRLDLASPLVPVRGDDLAPLARLRNLTLLDLNRTRIDDSALGPLDALPQLRAIWIRGARISDVTLARIVVLHRNLVSIEVDGSALTDAGVAKLALLPKLVMVILRGTPTQPGHLTDDSLIALGCIKSLRRLVVTCGRFSEKGLDGLQDLRLVRLGLRSVEAVPTAGVVRLVQRSTYEWLSLGGPGVTDDLLPHLAPSLVPRRAILDLADSAITDAGLAHLVPLPIFELVLNRTAITDAGLTSLPTTLGMRSVYLRDTKATPAGIAAFDRAHPGFRQPEGFHDDD